MFTAIFRFFESKIPAYPDSTLETPPSGLKSFCLHYTKGIWPVLIVMSVITAIASALEVYLFSFMGQLVDWLVQHDPKDFLQQEAGTLLIMAAILVVLMPALSFLHGAIVHQTLLGNYPMTIRWRAHRYLLRQSMTFYQNDFAGRVATKLMQTALSIRESVLKLMDVLVYILVYFVAMVFIMAQADWRMMFPILTWLVLYLGLQAILIPKLKRISTEQANARSLMTGRIVDSYTNILTIKLFSNNAQEEIYAKEGMDIFLQTVYQQMRYVTLLNAGIQTLNHLLTFSVAALSIWLWMNDNISVGAIAISVSLALRLNGMSQWIMWELSSLFESIGMVADGMSMLSKPIDIKDDENAKQLSVTQGNINFTDVCFHYGKDSGVIDNLSLHIKPGEKVGLVGRSGAGKSTVLNLLLRLYDIESGTIQIDDQNIHHTTQESLRAQIGMVTQDTSLLHRSVRENLLYGRPDATEADIQQALKLTKATEFVESLTDPEGNHGLDALVGERGVKLSGGQRQRIAIARVLLKNAPILLLDEATSALDSEIESAIQDSLYKLMKGKTVIAIAHRLSTIAAMDRLIILDQGKVVEQGKHEDLIQSNGIYAQLWKHQTGGYLPTADHTIEQPIN